MRFSEEASLPSILNALHIQMPSGKLVTSECQQHLGEHCVRAIAVEGTEMLTRGLEVVYTGELIQVPVGEVVRGRLSNVTGAAIDGMKQPETD